MYRTLCNATKCSCSYTASRTNGHVMLLIPCNSREYIKEKMKRKKKLNKNKPCSCDFLLFCCIPKAFSSEPQFLLDNKNNFIAILVRVRTGICSCYFFPMQCC